MKALIAEFLSLGQNVNSFASAAALAFVVTSNNVQ